MVYKINFTQCNFVYYDRTARSLNTRTAEHKKAVAGFDQNSKVASHIHHFSHNMNFEEVKVVAFEANYHKRLFLEAWHSALDPRLVTTISYFQKPTKASREHELHDHACKLRNALL